MSQDREHGSVEVGVWPLDATHGTVGVEEEFTLVDAATGECVAGIEALVARCPAAEYEIVKQVVEIGTAVSHSSEELLANIYERRAAVTRAAREVGLSIVASGTLGTCLPEDLTRSEGDRYAELELAYPWVWRETSTCGMHVHVGMRDGETAVRTCDAIRPYLPMLLALSANSPLWRGAATGLASIRALLILMHPRSGMPPRLESWERYSSMVDSLAESGPGDGSWIWWFARPHAAHGTIEVRICDPQSDVENSHAIACLVRALCLRLADGDAFNWTWREDPGELLLEDTLWNAIRSGPQGRCALATAPSLSLGELALEVIDALRDELTEPVIDRLRGLAIAPESTQQVDDLELLGSASAVTLALAERTQRPAHHEAARG